MRADIQKRDRRRRRKAGIRKRVVGTPQQPRLTVYRSLGHIYVQVIDDLAGRTLAAASSLGAKLTAGDKKQAAAEVGKAIGEKAKAAGITRVCFDRNGFRYHGRVVSLAKAAREAGLEF